ncbi:hypothetical protein [uncultured Maricaulis sp.]|uniref:hypothetical protein n=1 Tax=uncultured Maricaulis sp. TaxID=174710 RepID=UPI0030DD00B0
MQTPPEKPTRLPITAPAALRIGLPHLLERQHPVVPAKDARHASYVRLRELGIS